jgi:hypothetical protein
MPFGARGDLGPKFPKKYAGRSHVRSAWQGKEETIASVAKSRVCARKRRVIELGRCSELRAGLLGRSDASVSLPSRPQEPRLRGLGDGRLTVTRGSLRKRYAPVREAPGGRARVEVRSGWNVFLRVHENVDDETMACLTSRGDVRARA